MKPVPFLFDSVAAGNVSRIVECMNSDPAPDAAAGFALFTE
jgi:hypothetical protein